MASSLWKMARLLKQELSMSWLQRKDTSIRCLRFLSNWFCLYGDSQVCVKLLECDFEILDCAEQDSTMGSNFAVSSFGPHGILLRSTFPKPCVYVNREAVWLKSFCFPIFAMLFYWIAICGAVKKELKLSERIYRCTCGSELDRDVNAAVNIREEGRRILMARGCAW